WAQCKISVRQNIRAASGAHRHITQRKEGGILTECKAKASTCRRCGERRRIQSLCMRNRRAVEVIDDRTRRRRIVISLCQCLICEHCCASYEQCGSQYVGFHLRHSLLMYDTTMV